MSLSLSADPLSTELRARTALAHESAESSPYMTALVGGRVTALGLAALLGRLLPAYEALEGAAARWAHDPLVGRFVLPELHRARRLRTDLEHLTGCADGAVTSAAVDYAARIEEKARTRPAAFVAHHYTRYLGDLSGGQVIRAAVERSLGVSDGAGASFFAFPDVRAGAVKKAYRAHLDEVPFDAEQREELIEEALLAYRLNVALTRELDADLPRWTTA